MDIKLMSKILDMGFKARQNWKISVKALMKWLWKLTIITNQLIAIIIISFVNINH